MVSGTRDNTPPETTLASVYMWKRFPYRPSQSWLCMIVHNPYWIFRCADVLLSLSSTAVGLAKLSFTSWIQISALIPNLGISWHSLRWELSRSGEPKCEEKLPRLPGLSYLPRWDNSSTQVVSPPVGVIHINGCLNFTTTQVKVNSPRVTPGESCLGYPRPYNWGL